MAAFSQTKVPLSQGPASDWICWNNLTFLERNVVETYFRLIHKNTGAFSATGAEPSDSLYISSLHLFLSRQSCHPFFICLTLSFYFVSRRYKTGFQKTQGSQSLSLLLSPEESVG